jgi:Ni,Fe-hydrogenase III small subunit/ferredoxin-like protein FixX
MSFWFWHGLQKGIHTTRYPRKPESAPGVSPGRPVATEFRSAEEAALAAVNCPVGAITAQDNSAHVELGRCIHCQRCRFGSLHMLEWRPDYEWTTVPARTGKYEALPHAYDRSLHLIVVDAGDCGACLREVKHLNNPFYNIHRLGIFSTATPRAADVLLVVGPVSENMRVPLLKTYEAMPDPKRVVAVGACAITGGVFGRTFMSAGGAASVLPVDLEVPGDPPPPLAILHGLLAVTGRKPPTLRESLLERSA